MEKYKSMKEETLRNYFENTRGIDKIAIVFRDNKITYNELHKYSDIVAVNLLNNEVNTNDIIGICMKRTPKIFYAIMGVIKSGAAYVVMNYDWPDNRKNYIISQNNIKIVLTEDNIDDFLNDDGTIYDFNNLKRLKGDDIFAMVYTSGSTGLPKRVVWTNENMFYAGIPYQDNGYSPEISEHAEIILGITELSYALCMYEFMFAFINAKTLIFATEEECADVDGLANMIEKWKIDFMVIVPSRFTIMLKNERFRYAMRLIRGIITAGEPLSQNLLDDVSSLVSDSAILCNLFGSTESTIISISNNILHKKVAIGKPKDDIFLYIMDDNFNVLKNNEVGQICVKGKCVFPGRIGDKVYVSDDRYQEVDGIGRIYKTGDYGYLTENGELVCKGRIDNMVKFHGIKIELNEIKNVALNYDGIISALVRVVEEQNTKRESLCLYYTSNKEIVENDLIKYLKKFLPYYMIPTQYILIDNFPITSRGKIDTSQLPIPDYSKIRLEYLAPKNDKEKLVCEIFSKVLKLKEIGANESFLKLGGDSLVGMEILTLLYENGYEAYINELFQFPTAIELASVLRDVDNDENDKNDIQQLVPSDIQEQVLNALSEKYKLYDVECILPASFGQKQYVKMTNKTVNIYGGELINSFIDKKIYNEDKFKERIELISKSHSCLRSTFVNCSDNDIYQVIFKNKYIDGKYIDIKNLKSGYYDEKNGIYALQKEYISNIISEISKEKNADYTTKIVYLKLSENKGAFVISSSHAIIDGLGLAKLKKELIAENLLLDDDKYINLRQEVLLKEKNDTEANDFWKKYLDGLNNRLLPMNFFGLQNQNIDSVSISYDKTNTIKIKNYCEENDITFISFIEWCYGLALMDFLKIDEVVYFGFSSGRNFGVSSVKNVIAMLVNAVPIRQKRSDNIKDFSNQCFLIEKYSFLSLDKIWQAYNGHKVIIPINDGIHSTVFTEDDNILNFDDFNNQAVGNFLNLTNVNMSIRFNFNSFSFDKSTYQFIAQNIKDRIKELTDAI